MYSLEQEKVKSQFNLARQFQIDLIPLSVRVYPTPRFDNPEAWIRAIDSAATDIMLGFMFLWFN